MRKTATRGREVTLTFPMIFATNLPKAVSFFTLDEALRENFFLSDAVLLGVAGGSTGEGVEGAAGCAASSSAAPS